MGLISSVYNMVHLGMRSTEFHATTNIVIIVYFVF